MEHQKNQVVVSSSQGKKLLLTLSCFCTAFLLFSASAFASTGNLTITDTGSSSKLNAIAIFQTVLDFIQGPIMQFAGVVAILIAAGMYLLGEQQTWIKPFMKIVVTLTVVANVGNIISLTGFNISGALI